jgi:hypothetical protein
MNDAMGQLDVLLSIVLNRCKTQSLPTEMPSTVNLVDTTVFDLNCTTLKRLGVGPKVAGIYVKCQKMHHQSAGKRFFYGAQA